MLTQGVHMILRRQHSAFVLACLLLAGCASYEMQPPTVQHPANPDAPAAPPSPLSRTLAYTPSDIPSPQPVAAVPQEGQASHLPGETTSQTVAGEGEVVSTVPTAGQVVIDHEAINGFMEAMTMGYRVDPPKLLEGLKPGDRVRFTINVQKRTITAIEPLR
jgi:Cu/Ag efflux protein CusF